MWVWGLLDARRTKEAKKRLMELRCVELRVILWAEGCDTAVTMDRELDGHCGGREKVLGCQES